MENSKEIGTTKNIKIERKCEKNMETYLLLDKNEVVPLSVTLHLLLCKSCRTEVHYLSLAERTAAKTLKEKLPECNATKKMEAPKNPISMTKWIVGGATLTIFLLFFGVTAKSATPELQLLFYIFFAAAICAYCAVFIATNLDFFIKKIDTLSSMNLRDKEIAEQAY